MARAGTVRVRRGRSARAAGAAVAVTGAATGLGRAVAERFAADPGVRKVVALDDRRGDLDGVVWRVLDVADPLVAARLAGCDVVVHTAASGPADEAPSRRRAQLLRAVTAVLEGAAEAGVPRAVIVSSAMAYGALPGNPVPLDEDGPLLAVADESVAGDALELEAAIERVRVAAPELAVTVVRPALVVGPGADSALGRHLESPRLLVVKGTTPLWQFCHVDDLAAALHVAALTGIPGPLTVGCEGWLTQSEVEHVLGARRVELPALLAVGTADRLHRLGITRAPASELSYLEHPWVVSSTRLRAAGWRPVHDNVSALQALLAEATARRADAGWRPGSRESATLGAAGATVAAIGAAAVLRRSRRRRR